MEIVGIFVGASVGRGVGSFVGSDEGGCVGVPVGCDGTAEALPARTAIAIAMRESMLWGEDQPTKCLFGEVVVQEGKYPGGGAIEE